MKTNRQWLKSDRWDEWLKEETDQKKGIPMPEAQKPCPEGAQIFNLVTEKDFTIGQMPFIETVRNRQSRRKFNQESITLEELSFLLWATQGVVPSLRSTQKIRRTVPSGGCRHPFETYIVVNRVETLEPGLYRYLGIENQLCFLHPYAEIEGKIGDSNYVSFIKNPAATLIWTVIPYRTEWRYSKISDKIIALDAGHICQNLYQACEALGLGTCGYDGYDQDTLDAILGVDGEDEFTIYLGTAGRYDK